ncbi:unnamed protein product [Trichogramma brassicae]|uniref:Uncharacterized protein n=1 Tax=Trichogramma brassicae TaxID=86971 RepID=A0A6H5IRM6_9HYME|nr:unnamed protein product [Trichogramma brassicae]
MAVTNIVEKFLKFGQNPNCATKNGISPLNLALTNSRMKVIELLLRNGADPNSADDKGRTPVHVLIQSTHINLLIEYLRVADEIGRKVHVDDQDKSGETPLLLALRVLPDHLIRNVLRLLIKRGANPIRLPLNELAEKYSLLTMKTFFALSDEMNKLCITRQYALRLGRVNSSKEIPCIRDCVCAPCVRVYYKSVETMAVDSPSCLAKLKVLADRIDWLIGDQRDELLREVRVLIEQWQGPLPNLRDYFWPEVIDWLLVQDVPNSSCVRNDDDDDDEQDAGLVVIRFVARSGYRDEPEIYNVGKPLLRRVTPLHHAVKQYRHDGPGLKRVLEPLFKIYGAKNNYVDAEDEYSHFHIACEHGCDEIVEKFLAAGQHPTKCFTRRAGDSPLHLALRRRNKEVARLLLARGADPNVANKRGRTPLHRVCNDLELAEMLFEHARRRVEIDARDDLGNTALRLALVRDNREVAELLLRRGADPTLANNRNGRSPLHLIFKQKSYAELARLLLEVGGGKKVKLDVQDKQGNSPLHLAAAKRRTRQIELLLRHGADPNLANRRGLTCLDVCLRHDSSHDRCAIKTFLGICDEVGRRVRIDRASLGWAVTNFLPDVLDLLLDHGGADLLSRDFVFPRAEEFYDDIDSKLTAASGLLTCVEGLERRGYRMQRGAALEIVTLFDEWGFFGRDVDLAELLRTDKKFARAARLTHMKQGGVALYDVVQMPVKEATGLLTARDYHELGRAKKFWRLPHWYGRVCDKYLCRLMSRRFLRRWALDSLRELTRDRLSIASAERVLDNLENGDLRNICLATKVHERNDHGPGERFIMIFFTVVILRYFAKNMFGHRFGAVRIPNFLRRRRRPASRTLLSM